MGGCSEQRSPLLLTLTAIYPCRYHCLVTKYGKLEPLAEIDLRPRCRARVEVHCEEKVEQVCASVSVSIGGGGLAWDHMNASIVTGYQANIVAEAGGLDPPSPPAMCPR